VPDPAVPPDVISLEGFLGRSPRPRFWRLYQTLDLKSYVEIAEDDIVHSESLETKLQPLGGTVIWVKSGARLQHTRSESKLAEAGGGADQRTTTTTVNASKSNTYRLAITIDGVKGDEEGDWSRCCPYHIHRML